VSRNVLLPPLFFVLFFFLFVNNHKNSKVLFTGIKGMQQFRAQGVGHNLRRRSSLLQSLTHAASSLFKRNPNAHAEGPAAAHAWQLATVRVAVQSRVVKAMDTLRRNSNKIHPEDAPPSVLGIYAHTPRCMFILEEPFVLLQLNTP
jgi:hypothetical protein